MKSFYTCPQIAKILMVSEATVRRLGNAKLIRYHLTPGGHRRFTRESILEYATENNIPVNLDDSEHQTQAIKILVVDDDRMVNQAIFDYFKIFFQSVDEQVQIEQAFDGFDAGAIVIKSRPDLIILDIKMPGLDGFEVCKRIRSVSGMEHAVIASITGYHTPEIEKKILDAGADYCFPKPLPRKVFLPIIKQLLKNTW